MSASATAFNAVLGCAVRHAEDFAARGQGQMNKALEFQKFVTLGTIRASTTQEVFMPTKTETATPQLCSAFLGTGEIGAKGRSKLNAVIPVAEAELEKTILQAGAAKAPRLTPTDIDACIVREHYFTAAQGAHAVLLQETGVALFTPEMATGPLSRLTFCVLTLRNGFTVTGESACASPENFNAEIGVRIARENAREKIWMLEGYLLRERLNAAQ